LRQFKQAAQTLAHRIGLFCSLPIEKLDRMKLASMTKEIGRQSSKEQ